MPDPTERLNAALEGRYSPHLVPMPDPIIGDLSEGRRHVPWEFLCTYISYQKAPEWLMGKGGTENVIAAFRGERFPRSGFFRRMRCLQHQALLTHLVCHV